MAHTIKLAFKDNPSGSDDFIDFASGMANVGYFHVGTDLGQPAYNDYYKRLTRTITIQAEVRDTTFDGTIAKVRSIIRYLKSTEYYFGKFQGNIPARTDGAWHQGHAAVLSYKNTNATNLLYFNLFGGDVATGDITNDPVTLNLILPITITMLAEGAARGDRAYLANLISAGGFEPPFDPASATYNAGWTFTGTWASNKNFSTPSFPANQAKFPFSITTSTAGATATSYTPTTTNNELAATTTVCVPTVTLLVTPLPTSSTLSVIMQIWNGASWATQQTLASITSAGGITANTWTTFYGTAYTLAAGITQVRLLITNATGCTVWATGAGIAKDPVNSVAPSEFVSDHKYLQNASYYLYNVQGDMEAPCLIQTQLVGTGTSNNQVLLIGRETYKGLIESTALANVATALDQPIYPTVLRCPTATTAAPSLFWGLLGNATSGVATSTTYTINPRDIYLNIDFRPRKYRAFLAYAANDANLTTAITSVTLKLATYSNSFPETKTWTVNIPYTYTGNTVPVEANYKLYMLGDFFHYRPANGELEIVQANYAGAGNSSIVLTHANSANRNMGVGGIVLIPEEDFAIIDATGAANPNTFFLFGESTAPKAGVYTTFTTTPQSIDLQSYTPTGNYATNGIILEPNGGSSVYTANRMSIMMFRSRDSTDNNLITYNATDAYWTIIRYSPRYLAVR